MVKYGFFVPTNVAFWFDAFFNVSVDFIQTGLFPWCVLNRTKSKPNWKHSWFICQNKWFNNYHTVCFASFDLRLVFDKYGWIIYNNLFGEVFFTYTCEKKQTNKQKRSLIFSRNDFQVDCCDVYVDENSYLCMEY